MEATASRPSDGVPVVALVELVALLGRCRALPVLVAAPRGALEAGRGIVAAPGKHLLITRHALRVDRVGRSASESPVGGPATHDAGERGRSTCAPSRAVGWRS